MLTSRAGAFGIPAATQCFSMAVQYIRLKQNALHKAKMSLQKIHLIGINGEIKSIHKNYLLKDTFIYKVYEVGNPKGNYSPNRSRN